MWKLPHWPRSPSTADQEHGANFLMGGDSRNFSAADTGTYQGIENFYKIVILSDSIVQSGYKKLTGKNRGSFLFTRWFKSGCLRNFDGIYLVINY